MTNALFENGRNAFLNGGINWGSDTINAALLDLTQSTAAVKQITAATNASPIVITASSHGFAVGDIVYVSGVGGNLAANGSWTVSAVTTNTFTLQNSSGSGSYTSGGRAVNMGPSVANYWSEISGCLVGTATALAGESSGQGIANASQLTFSSVSGNPAQAVCLYKNTGTPSTSRLIALISGDFIVTAAQTAAGSATTIYVNPLPYAIASGTTLTFSNGQAATLTAQANAGAYSLAVSALSGGVTQGSQALAPQLGAGLPVTPNGNNIVVTWDVGVNKIFKL